jgi:hypothetical protein
MLFALRNSSRWSKRAGSSARLVLALSVLLAAGGIDAQSALAAGPVLFGDQNVESGNDSDVSGMSEAFPFVNGTSGTAQSITVYITKKHSLNAALYSSKSSRPGSLLASGSLAASGTGWQTVTIPSTSVTSGATYWIALLGPVNYRDGSTAGCSSYSASFASFPSSFPAGQAWQSCPLSAYVSGTTTVARPSNTSLPVISGTPQQGQTLTASTGAWTGNPTSYSYQWSDGAQGVSDTLTAADVGKTITVAVTATNAGGSTTATSAGVGPITALPAPPQNTAPPTITGAAQQGQTLAAATGTWTNSPTSYTYQWQDCNSSGTGCVNIAGATNSTYAISASDSGYTIVVVVTATNSAGSASQASSPTGVVAGGGSAPVNTAPPTITGAAQQGQTLAAATGTWTNSPTSYTYQWQDCNSSGTGCVNIIGATNSTYTIASSDNGYTIGVVVTATNSAGSTSQASSPTGVVFGTVYAFDNEFNGTSIDQTQWAILDSPGEADQSEPECYFPSQATEAGGYAVLTNAYSSSTTTCDNVGNNTVVAGGTHYMSGAINMAHTTFTYGTVDVRGEFAADGGAWPAVWMLGYKCQDQTGSPISTAGAYLTVGGWYAGGQTGTCQTTVDRAVGTEENDIGDFLWGNNEAPYYSQGQGVESTIHFSNGNGIPYDLNIGSDTGTTFHDYTMVWTSTYLSYSLNGSQYYCVYQTTSSQCPSGGYHVAATGAIPSTPEFLIFNSAECINTAAGCTSNTSDYPQVTKIDYVHVTSPGAAVNTSLPTISGTTVQGNTLSVSSVGSWTNSPTSYTVTWMRDGTTNISGEYDLACPTPTTCPSYTLTAGDEGHTINAVITETNSNGTMAASSASTATVN